jgi:hypothetical protein
VTIMPAATGTKESGFKLASNVIKLFIIKT